MTSFNENLRNASAQAAREDRAASFRGVRNEGLAVSEVAGVLGGLIGGAAVYAQGGSPVAALAGAVCGGLGGYAAGNMMSPISNLTTSTKILTGIGAGCFGISVAGLAASIVEAFSGNTPDAQ
jgi:hypothetical protein